MKNVLIIVYYWPPSGGAGVQRWLRFVKHLRDFGWEPTIYTAKDAAYAVYDENLFKEIPEGIRTLRLEVPEPNNWISKWMFWKKDTSSLIYSNQQQAVEKKSYLKKLLWWIRGNFFIPDARFLWVKPSVRFLKKNIAQGEFDAVISTGPPHSLHLIGEKVSKHFGIPWLADFRDPWVSMDYLQAINLTKFAVKKHQQQEERVVKGADKVVVVGNVMRKEFLENHGVDATVIHNGFNKKSNQQEVGALDSKFSIVHIGSFTPRRNCDDLWQVLTELVEENSEFADHLEIKLIGNTSPNILASIERLSLKPYLNHISYIKYEETLMHSRQAQVLLLPIDRIDNAEFVVTGKIFEYLNAKRPILLIGPDYGDGAMIIKNCQAGYCCNFDDHQAIKESVLMMYQMYLDGVNHIKSVNVDSYSGYELTRKLAGELNQMLEN